YVGPRGLCDEVRLGVGIPRRRLGVDIAGAEPVAERGQRGELPPAPVNGATVATVLEHERPPPLLDERHRGVLRQLAPTLAVESAERDDRAHDRITRLIRPERHRVQECWGELADVAVAGVEVSKERLTLGVRNPPGL